MDASRHEEVLRSLFRESNDAFFLFDPSDLSLEDVNPAALRLTGFDRKAVLTMRVDDLFTSDDSLAVGRLIEAYRKTGVFHSREDYRLRRAEGEPIAVNLSASRIHTTPTPLGLVVARDISERRKAQDALERFFLLSPALFGILAPSGRLIKANRAWEALLGYTPEELSRVDLLQLVHPDDRAVAGSAIERGQGEVAGQEIRCHHRDGTERSLSWSSTLVDGNCYVVAMDVTATKEAAALRHAKESAEAANRAKGQFLSSMSHELRTPLSAILTLVDVLIGDPSSRSMPADLFEDLQTIRRNGQHLLQLINRVLNLAKIEVGKLDVLAVPCDPARIAMEVAEMMRGPAEAKGLTLGVESASPMPQRIRSDPVRLRQILINLVGNAIKFTEKGGVVIRIGHDPLASPSPTAAFEVIDTGIGLAPEEIASLFVPFHQIDRSKRGNSEGTGLGLAISRRLADALHGSLRVESKPGAGSTFFLLIPTGTLSEDETTPVTPEPADVPEAPHVKRVLLAEDNADNRRAIGLRLQQCGIDVTPARHGQEALDLVLSEREAGRAFDVILMDMQMPVLDGYEATRQIRRLGFEGRIIALTAFAFDEDREECLKIGCDAHISKPIEWDRLLQLINEPSRSAARVNK